MSNQPRFLPPEGKAEWHLGSTDGHSCVIYDVSPEDNKPGTTIPERFRKLAIGDGCGVVGLDFVGSKESAVGKEELIIAAIAAVMKRDDADDLEGDERPKLAAVTKEVGFKVTKTQFEAAWPKFVDGLGIDEDVQDD